MKIFFMVKYFFFTLLFICTVPSYSATTSSFNDPKADQVFIALTGTGMSMTLSDYIQLKPSDFKRLRGQKLTWKEMMAFAITKRQVKKALRKNSTPDTVVYQEKTKEPFKWHWGGFFLGMLVPIGFIVTLFIKDEKRKNRIISALFGMAIVLLIGFLIGVIIMVDSI